MSTVLWQPSTEQIANANITRFRQKLVKLHNIEMHDYANLYQWTLQNPELFWQAVWQDSGIISDTTGNVILRKGTHMHEASWFPDARLNFAENLLCNRGESDSIVFWNDAGKKNRISHKDLYYKVAQLRQALQAHGVGVGDRVAGYLPNIPESIIAMLATTSLGAIWSSCSTDFGVDGVLDRFSQITPKVLFATDGHYANSQPNDCLNKLEQISDELQSLEHVIIIPYVSEQPDLSRIKAACTYATFTSKYKPEEIIFPRLPFDHPVYILFSSGTTGVPKCIVHGAGGTLLQHLKEHRLHCDIKNGDRIFFQTTCGWMMWNWLVSGLASGATLLLFDGSPFSRRGKILFDYAQAEKATLFGASAKYFDAIKKLGLKPKEHHDLSTLRMICSTGSPLMPETFEYSYTHIKEDICLASISGGTDIVSCFALGNPTLPVYAGELQCRGLGMQVEVWNDNGEPVQNEKGQLVCTAPFPSMPIGFWNDPDGHNYHAAYFEEFPGVWCHGDYVQLTEHDGMIIYGRSDAVLNPGGVRIGTAEIYRQVEQLDEIMESLVIGQAWNDDVRVVLFVSLREGMTLNDKFIRRIKAHIRNKTTQHHVPQCIIQVSDIPRTRSGKIVEMAVSDVIHGREVKNINALANPEVLQQFKNREELTH